MLYTIVAELTARMAFTNPINLLYLLFTWLNQPQYRELCNVHKCIYNPYDVL